MAEENFWADVHVEEAEPGVFVPVLVMGGGDDPDRISRLVLSGEYQTPDAARNAALEAITAMALEPAQGAAGVAPSTGG